MNKDIHILKSDKVFVASSNIFRLKDALATLMLDGQAIFNTKHPSVRREFALPLKPKGYKLRLNTFNIKQVLTRLFNEMNNDFYKINEIVLFKHNGCYLKITDAKIHEREGLL